MQVLTELPPCQCAPMYSADDKIYSHFMYTCTLVICRVLMFITDIVKWGGASPGAGYQMTDSSETCSIHVLPNSHCYSFTAIILCESKRPCSYLVTIVT